MTNEELDIQKEIENYFIESTGFGRDKIKNFMDIVNKALKQKGERIAELENKIADIKANCDLAIEGRDVKIKELEKENAELKAEIENDRDLPTVAYMQGAEKQKKKDEEQLTKATEFLNEFMRIGKASDEDFEHDYSELIRETEQFLKGEDIILEDAQAGNSPFDADEVFNKEMKAYSEEK